MNEWMQGTHENHEKAKRINKVRIEKAGKKTGGSIFSSERKEEKWIR